MELINYIISLWKGIFNRRRFSIQNAESNVEERYIYISYAKIYIKLLYLTLIIFIVFILLVLFTPMMQLFPGYKSEVDKAREHLIENSIYLDSLERVIDEMKVHSDNIAIILGGGNPTTNSKKNINIRKTDKYTINPSVEDLLLRAQMEGKGVYKINNVSLQSTSDLRKAMELAIPADGIVTSHFNIKDNIFGISITTAPSTRISAVESGTVIMNAWTPKNNYIIQIQHSNNRISTYKNLSQTLVVEGISIKKGDLIGYSHEISDDKKEIKPFVFELWDDGKPVDPEQYIIF